MKLHPFSTRYLLVGIFLIEFTFQRLKNETVNKRAEWLPSLQQPEGLGKQRSP